MFTLHSFAHCARRLALACTLPLVLALAACGGGGGGSSSPQAPAVHIAVAPSSITLGQSATLTWSSVTGDSCSASGGWTGAEAASGTATVTPTTAGSVTYTLSCSGGTYSGSTSASAALSVAGPSAYSFTSLVADTSGVGAAVTDANLINPWGLAFGPTSFSWVANNHTQTSTLYDGNGRAQPAAAPLVVAFTASGGGVTFDATGIIYNGTSDFAISANGATAAATFIFVGEGGMIAGWAPSVDLGHAINVYTDAGGAVYKGLALASNGTANYLYATDFFNGRVDVFDTHFTRQATSATSFAFVDPTLPAGYAPFGIQALPTGSGGSSQIYVTYAQQSPPANHDNVNGAGLGLVDVYDTSGNFIRHLVTTGGLLDAPWGIALAPADFGTLSHAVLVGNFGDGRINGYDAASGAYVGTLANAGGTAFASAGLWGIAFGNDHNNQPHNTLFYAAGTNNEANGAYGRIDLGATAPILNAPPVVAITTPTGSVAGTVTVTASAQDSLTISNVQLFVGGVSLGVISAPPYSAQWDTTTLANGSVALTATATDVDGNVGTSPAVTVTVANGVAASTLTQLQSQIFTPICSVCHDGSLPASGALPGSQNLTAGNAFTSLVNVASHEQPTLLRVKPGDAANSYVIQKLEGTAASGARMPLGGPYLDQATIDRIKSWIAAGALNN